MKDTNVQWHPGFIGAMNLELKKNRDDLLFEKEYNLNTKPLEVDLLVIKKNAGIQIDNVIGKIFRGHNLFEYKSPKDELDIDTFYKAVAYASLYKSYGKTVDSIKADDITISLVRKAKPYGLFRCLKENGYQVLSPYHGIYYIEGKIPFSTQIVATRELNPAEHIWLGSLSDELEKQNLLNLLAEIGRLHGKADQEYAQSVLEVGLRANEQALKELIGDKNMSEELLEILKPIIEPKMILREQKGLEQGIKGTVEALRYLGHDNIVIKETIKRQYHLSEEAVERYMCIDRGKEK